ncbi:MAG: hydrogenase iron-sulfur subunit, partial [Anaerolineae bacterium]
MWPEGRARDRLEVFLLLCEELGGLGEGLDLGAIAEWIERRLPAVRVRREPKLCGRIGQALGNINGAQRLILGVCSPDFAATELQRSARQAGLDPFGVEVVNLGTFCARVPSRLEGTDKAKLLLGAAVAKARAFPRSGPENTKPLLAWGDTKVSRRALFTLPPIHYEAVPSIRPADCAAGKGCRVCATTCPHQALNPSGEGAMLLDKTRCTACGACVSVCPRTAIELPGASPKQFEAHLAALLNPEVPTPRPRGILFLCPRSALALEKLAGNGQSLAAGWLPVEVPCLGMVTPNWLLHGLRLGAAAVGVLPCPSDICRFGQRDTVWERVDYVRELLLLLGGEAD